jgi:hypothetical protein
VLTLELLGDALLEGVFVCELLGDAVGLWVSELVRVFVPELLEVADCLFDLLGVDVIFEVGVCVVIDVAEGILVCVIVYDEELVIDWVLSPDKELDADGELVADWVFDIESVLVAVIDEELVLVDV